MVSPLQLLCAESAVPSFVLILPRSPVPPAFTSLCDPTPIPVSANAPVSAHRCCLQLVQGR
jgi:hypothetical protein